MMSIGCWARFSSSVAAAAWMLSTTITSPNPFAAENSSAASTTAW
jgi:hypothetical protein